MNVLDDTTRLHVTLAEKVSVYEIPLPNTEGYDNPIANDDAGFNSPEQPPAYALTYSPLVSSSSVNIGDSNTPEPPSDPQYLVLVDDKGRLGNPSDVRPPHVDISNQETPVDTRYLKLLHDERNTRRYTPLDPL